LYMAAPVYAIFASITGDNAYRDFMDREFWKTVAVLYDKEEKLFHQEEGTKQLREPNGEKMFWGRGNGWVIGALSLVMDLLPDDYPSLPRYQDLYREMTERIVSLQQESGYWHSSLLDPVSYPDPETSATGFFAFGLWWGINNGLLSQEDYLVPAVKAWEALVRAVHPNGMPGYVQAIGGRPALEIPADASEVYGTGAFMLTGLEICKYLEAGGKADF
ncbi:MAG: glycoside hydrolase family 88 protein, partial [Bacteroidales bacterium]|nr:glycoside hydrolase family 88 protein [Bacteroidales bacterium]